MKTILRNAAPVRSLWTEYRRRQLLREYRERRESYARLASQRGLHYREDDVRRLVRSRLEARGYTAPERALGAVHTFAFLPNVSWHSALIPDLQELGLVTWFDYSAHGYSFHQRRRGGAGRRREMNRIAIEALRAAHAKRPVDWVFVYGNGSEVEADALRKIRDELGIPLVTMCLDDKHSWRGPVVGGQHVGQIDIAPLFDLCWTSARIACEWYLVEGAIPLYMPEGFDSSSLGPSTIAKDLQVSFVGGAYGFRPAVIEYLRRYGIAVAVFGAGWPRQTSGTGSQGSIYNRSLINLGMGGIGHAEELTNVKGRDFEVPGTGGGMYLTSFNSDLAQHFAVGSEIACYRSRDEMLELIRYYLARPHEAEAMAAAGRRRALAEHRWLHRYVRLCRILGILSDIDR